MRINGAQAMIKALEAENVDTIFGYPGKAICPFYNALLDSSIRHILTRHEQGAAHAASGYARVTGKTGVCVATSGPGATNLITGIATAYMDSIPMVAITGQVSTDLIGKDAFQEADITGATIPFCKYNYLVKNVKDLPRVFREAFHIAASGRPGPVLIDVPEDLQLKEFNFEYPVAIDIKGYKPNYTGHALQIKKVALAIQKARKPVICAGGGIISGGADSVLRELAEKWRIPVTTTMMGIGSIPSSHELNFGMIGSHGSNTANYAIHHADLLLILGARVGDRAMGAAWKTAERAVVIHVDIDPAEIGKNMTVTIPVVGDIRNVIEGILKFNDLGTSDTSETSETSVRIVAEERLQTLSGIKIEQMKKRDSLIKESFKSNTVNPRYLLSILPDYAGEKAVVTTEVGQNQIWAANNYPVTSPRTFITSGGMGTMGYGLPSGVGACVGLAGKNRNVVVISGDGSFQMSMQELGTIKQSNLNVKIIIFNNCRLGLVRELQTKNFCSRYSQVCLDNNPDFIKIADAYGFGGRRISCNTEVPEALAEMINSEGAYILECIVDPEEPTL